LRGTGDYGHGDCGEQGAQDTNIHRSFTDWTSLKRTHFELRPASARAPPEFLARLVWFVVGLDNVHRAGRFRADCRVAIQV